MTAPALFEESESVRMTGITSRLERLEAEMVELRQSVADLAQLVAGDIRDRRSMSDSQFGSTLTASASTYLPGSAAAPQAAQVLRRPWLLIDLLREFWWALRMCVDPRYQVRGSTKLLVPAILMLFGLSYLAFHHTFLDIPVFRHLAQGVIDLILAILLYKVLSREVARYRHARSLFPPRSAPPPAGAPVPVNLWNTDPDSAAVTRQELA